MLVKDIDSGPGGVASTPGPGRNLIGGSDIKDSMAARRQASAEVAAWLRRYEPRFVAPELWHAELRDFVVPAVGMLAPATTSSAGETARALTRISAWCLSQGMTLDWDRVLDPDTVERFVCVGITDDHSRGTYRALLRRLGPLLTSKAPCRDRRRSAVVI
jgi:hypothetical protein